MKKSYVFLTLLLSTFCLSNFALAGEVQTVILESISPKSSNVNQIFSPQPDTLFYDDDQPSSLNTTTGLWTSTRFTAPQDFTLNSIYCRLLNQNNNTTAGATFWVYNDLLGSPGTAIAGPFNVPAPLPSGFPWFDVEVVPGVAITANSDFHIIYGPTVGGAYPSGTGWWNLLDGSTSTQRTRTSTNLTGGPWSVASGDAFIRAGGAFTGNFVDLQTNCVGNDIGKFHLCITDNPSFTVEVENLGNATDSVFTVSWQVVDDIASSTVFNITESFGPIASGQKITATASTSWIPTNDSRYTVTATVVSPNDQNFGNNISTLEQYVTTINNPTQLSYDGGVATTNFQFSVGSGWGLQYSPCSFPVSVDSLHYFFGGSGTADLRLFLNDGPNGEPNTLIWSDTLANAVTGWNNYDVPDIIVNSPFTVFYMFETGVTLGIDGNAPVAGANSCMPNVAWQATNFANNFNPDETGDWMMRPTIKPVSAYYVSLNPPNQTLYGASGGTTTYNLTLTNAGTQADSYTLATTGGTYTNSFLINGQITTQTPILNSGQQIDVEVSVIIPATANSGDLNLLTLTAISDTDPTVDASTDLTTFVLNPGLLPLIDDFESGSLNPLVWIDSSQTDPNGYVNTIAPNPPSGTHALHLNSTPTGGDTIVTGVFDLSALTNVQLWFSYERGASVEAPDANEFLRAEYLDNTGVWQQVPNAAIEGNSTQETSFTQVITSIPQNGLHSFFRLRFRTNGTVSATAMFDNFAIDDIFLGEAPDFFYSINPLNISANGPLGGIANFQVKVENLGTQIDSYDLQVSGNTFTASILQNGTPITNTGNVNPGDSTFFNVEVTIPGTATVGQIDNFSVLITSVGDPTTTKTVTADVTAFATCVNSFPLNENFDAFTAPLTLTPQGWENATDDQMDWTVDANGTSSQDTGPSGDHTTGTGNYLYTETSSFNNQTAHLVSPCLDLSLLTVPQARFWYHMYGATMGSLHVDVFDFTTGNWTLDVSAPLVGQQQTASNDPWLQKVVDLSAFGNQIRVRLRAITGISFTSDMAIDDFFVGDAPNYFVNLVPSTLNGSAPEDATETYSITIQNLGLNDDTYTLNLNTAFSGQILQNGSPIAQTPLVTAGNSTTIDVEIMVPIGATIPIDNATLTVTSIGDPNVSAIGSINTDVVLSSGGPDTFGHSWISSLNNSIPAVFENIAQTGITFGVTGSNVAGTLTLPWSFPFYGNNYTTALVSSNGYITFGSDGTDFSNDPIPSTIDPNDFIAPFWTNLTVDGGLSNMFWFNDSLNSRVIIQWNEVERSGESLSNTFQVILYPDGRIDINYENMNSTNLSNPLTVGIEDATASDGLQIAYNEPFVDSNLSVRITTVDTYPPIIDFVTEIGDTDVHDQSFDIYLHASDGLSGIDPNNVTLNWKFSTGTTYNVIPMTITSNDTFFAQIAAPNQFGLAYEYFVSVEDYSQNIAYFPYDPVNQTGSPFTFDVRLVTPGTLTAESLIPDFIPLSWEEPGENGIQLKYDDGSSEFISIFPNSPPGLNSPGAASFATKFDIANQTQISGNAQLTSVKIYITNNALATSEYNVKIYQFDSANNIPGNLITEIGPFDQSGTTGDFIEFDFTDPVTGLGINVGNGEFCVGVEQITNDKISLGGDTSLNPPYTFNNDTHFLQGVGTAWEPVEFFATSYGQVIPMIRCFVEPITVSPIVVAPKTILKKTALSKSKFLAKKSAKKIVSKKGTAKISLTPTWNLVEYKLYKTNGAAQNSNEVVTNGSVIYTGTAQNFDDFTVINPNQYSYAVTAVYDVNGTNTESEPGNLQVGTPGVSTGAPIISANDLDFGDVLTGTLDIKNLMIHNTGTAPLNVTDLTFTGTTVFTLSQSSIVPPFIISAGDSQAVEIAFYSDLIGVFNGVLEIGNNSPNTPFNVNLTVDCFTASIEPTSNIIPEEFSLSQNYPNPFNPQTNIEFGLKESRFTKLVIYDILGREVKTLVNENLPAAFYKVVWDGRNSAGNLVSSGVYFYKIEAKDFVEVKKLMFLK
ncbi:MAG: choice-of-anchor D domain-containing protein [Calditrichaeota bacterium]|nr:MAG: choice-of-anchor D domain-containing protein [Calditrichota bacterium]